MPIATLDELAAVPEGTTVHLLRGRLPQDWVRTATGLSRQDVDLELSRFTGAVTEGLLTLEDPLLPYSPGDVIQRTGTTIWNMVAERLPDADGQQWYRVAQFSGDEFYGMERIRRDRLDVRDGMRGRRVVGGDRTPQMIMCWGLVYSLNNEMGMRLAAEQRVSEARATQPTGIPRQIIERLHRLAEDECGLDEALADIGIPRPREVVARVKIFGTYALEESDAHSTLNDDGRVLNFDDYGGEIEWYFWREITHEEAGGCICSEVTRGDVEPYISGFRSDSWDFEVEYCSAD